MLRKFCKKLSILALMLFAVGIFALLPSTNNSKVEDACASETTTSESFVTDLEADDTWVNKLSTTTTYSLTSVTGKADATTLQERLDVTYSVKLITSASDLAYLAYAVNSGIEIATDTVYFLTADIDLAGHFWTPIGTPSYPFQGIFYGNGYTISNVIINDYSIASNTNSAAGIFGNSLGVIANVKLGGTFYINTSKTKGSLVGFNRGYVVECTDNATKQFYNGTTSEDAKTIGTGSSQTTCYHLTINNDAVYKRANNPWYEDKTLRIVDDTLPGRFDLYQNLSNFKLRENASASNVYPLLQGYIANMEDVGASLSENKVLGFNPKTVDVNFNYGYGSRTNISVTFEYDETFQSWFGKNPSYLTRAGYTINRIYNSKGTDYHYPGTDFQKAYSSYSENSLNNEVYFSWDSPKTITYYVQPVIASDEGGAFTSVNSAINSVAISNNGTLSNDNSKYIMSKVTVGTTSTFTIKLQQGYELIQNVYSGENGKVVVSSGKANKTSGVYYCFKNYTGTGSSYNSSGNNDSYNFVTGTISEPSSDNTYTITVNNLVGNDGYVYLVIQRKDIKVKLTNEFVDISNATTSFVVTTTNSVITGTTGAKYKVYKDGEEVEQNLNITFTWTLADASAYKKISTDGSEVYLTYKAGEEAVLTLTITSGDVVILSSNTSGNNLSSVVSKENKDSTRIGNKYKSWIYTITAVTETSPDVVTVLTTKIGSAKSRVQVQFCDANGNTIDFSDKKFDGIYFQSTNNLNWSNQIQNAKTLIGVVSSTTNNDKFTISGNGYYQAEYLTIDGIEDVKYYVVNGTVNSNEYGSKGQVITKVYEGGSDEVNHTIKVYLKERSYKVSYQFIIGSTDYTSEVGELFTIADEYSGEFLAGTEKKITLTLTDIGKGILYYDKIEITNSTGTAPTGYQLNSLSINNSNTFDTGEETITYNIGTYEAKIKIYFNFKQVNIQVDNLYNADTGLIDRLKPTNQTCTFGYKTTADINTAVILTDKSLTDISFTGIDISSQYYLVGWYLSTNQKVYTDNGYDTIIKHSSIINDMVNVGKTAINKDKFDYSNVYAAVRNRTVTVNYYAEDDNKDASIYDYNTTTGATASKTKTAGTITYGQILTINNNQFSRIGYTFEDWAYTCGSLSGNSYSITGTNWYALFNIPDQTTGFVTWNTFDTKSQNWFNASNEVTLTAEWDVITYQIMIDNSANYQHANEENGNTQATIQIGQTISFNNNNGSKNGLANYIINSVSYQGSTLNGYTASSFNISHGNKTENITSYTFSVENAKALLSSDNYFVANNSNSYIEIQTQRNPANYLVYIRTSKYYSVATDSTKLATYGGGTVTENNVTYVYVTATYDAVVSNLTNAIGKAITFSRTGYNHTGYMRVNSSGSSMNSVFDPAQPYTVNSDIYIVPTWTRKSTTTSSSIAKCDDVTGSSFYLFNSHDVIKGVLAGNNTNEDSLLETNFILTNGEVISNYYFEVTYGSETTATTISGKILNINNFNKAGTYKVKFSIVVDDGLIKAVDNKYTVTSDEITFTMVKNEIAFAGSNLHSTYNGTSEFIATEENDFGYFYYKYDWDGSELSAEIGKTETYFNNYSITGTNFNAGSGKALKAYLVTSQFDLNNEIGTNYNELFSNVVKDSIGFYTTISGLTIDKAKFTISFTDGSAYYFEGITTIVYTNTENLQFTIGSVTFTYNYNQILLNKTAFGTYTGAEDHTADSDNFIVTNLVIENHETDLDANFEWNISQESSFELIDPTNAIKLKYQTKYIIAQDGKLKSSFAIDYLNISETLSISNVLVGGESVAIPTISNQFSYSVNNDILFSIVNNNTSEIIIYINNETLARNSLSYNVVVNLTSERALTLSMLSWGNSATVSDYSNLFEQDFTASTTNQVSTTSITGDATVYAILTDVVKLNIDYNGGTNSQGKASDSYYISALNEKRNVANPVHEYEGLIFAGFSNLRTSNITATVQSLQTGFKVTKGGKAENIKAKWNFNNIVGEQVEDEFTSYASVSGLTLKVSDVANVEYPEGTTSKTFTLTSGLNSYAYDLTTTSFLIKNSNGMADTSMSGAYVMTITAIYNDGVQNPQTQSVSYNLTYNIEINKVGIKRDTTKTLTFNNTNQIANVDIITRLNGVESSTTLDKLPLTDNSGSSYGFYITILSTSKSLTEINQVDTYKLTANIDSNLTQIYQIEVEGTNNYGSAYVVVEQFTILLKDYQEQINLAKIFGLSDPTLESTITIATNNNDEVKLSFTRVAGEAIGEYALTFNKIVLQADEDNYEVNTTGFARNFEIIVPESNLKVEFKDNLTYTYNGYVLNNLTVSFNGTNYTLTGVAGEGTDFEENVSTTFDFYYMSGTTKIEIPSDQKDEYAGYITFTSATATRNVGEYAIQVRLSDDAGDIWKGVDITNTDSATIVVEKRDITVTEIIKTFDQTNSYLYNNKSTSKNTADSVTITNIVSIGGAVEEIQVSGKIANVTAGYQNITELVLDSTSVSGNYNLIKAENLQVLVIPSKEAITTTSSTKNLNYGNITSSSDIDSIVALIPLSYNSGKVSNDYIEATSFDIADDAYSNGGYLNVRYNEQGEIIAYSISFTLTSKNYTFGQDIKAVGDSYSITAVINVTIDKITLNLNNTSLEITKPYDGYNNVLDKFVGQNVNTANGYFSAIELLTGDLITIDSATYNDREIATNKEVTAVLSGDYKNYNVIQSLKGSIVSVYLTFVKNAETESFVDGTREFTNTQNITYAYTSDLPALINHLTNSNTFISRVGYTQTGWTYVINGTAVSIKDMTDSEKEKLLQDAVDAGSTGITLNAVWEINKYKLKVIGGANATTSITEQEFNYYDTFNDITVDVNSGYTFEGVELSANVATLAISEGLSTRNGKFNLVHILNDLTTTIVTEEITVKIVIDYNNPESFAVDTKTTGWTSGVKEREMKYSELKNSDLPVLFVTTENTYNFLKWQLESNGTYADNSGSSIWERIGGDNFTEDNLTGFNFKAIWTEAPLTITVNASNASVTVNLVNGSEKEELTLTNGSYNVYYNDTVEFVINSNDWYKWSDLQINGSYQSITGNSTATQASEGTFTLNTIKASLTVNIIIDTIDITFTTGYTTPAGTTIIEENGSVSGIYSVDQTATTTISTILSFYTATEGTYDQDYWTYGEKVVNETDNIKDTIVALYGSIPTSDITLNLSAHFKGKVWTLTFVKNNVESYFEESGAGSENTVLELTKTFVYGQEMQNIPSLISTSGKAYVWINETGEYFYKGMVFTTASIPSTTRVMTITADWKAVNYQVIVTFDGQNSSQVEEVTVDGEAYTSGQVIESLWGTSKVFTFNLKEGYEIDADASNVSKGENYDDSYQAPVLTVSGNVVTIKNIQGNTNATVAIKAKDYKIKVTSSSYETISKNEYDIAYDQDISDLSLNINNFSREGYTLESLVTVDTNKVFATYLADTNRFTFGSDFVSSNVYKNDGNLTLKATWKSDKDYLSAYVTVFSGYYFNGTEQTIANASLQTINSETVTEGALFKNGDKVVDIYYVLDGVKIDPQENYSLIYRNVINNKDVYIAIDIKDTLTNDTITYTVTSTVQKVSLLASKIIIDSATLESYYSGTKVFYPTSNNSYGTLKYQDTNSTAISEVSIEKVEIIDNNNLYNVNNGYSVKYYFNVSGDFNANNYSQITKEGNFWTLETSEVTANVVKTPITITVSGKAYENQKVQEVTSTEVSKPDYVKDFTVTINSVKTKTATAKVYTNEFDIDWTITKNGDKTENFTPVYAGSYEIASSELAYKVNTYVKYFSISEVTDLSNINITLTSAVYNGERISINDGEFTFIKNNELIFSISSNGTSSPLVQVTKGLKVSFGISTDNEMAVLTWTNTIDVDALIESLQTISAEGENVYSQEFSEETSVYTILTDYKALLISHGDKGGDQGYKYVKLGESVNAEINTTWTGFTFASWQSSSSGVSVSGNTFTAVASAKITPVTISAVWNIVAPTGNSQNVTRQAKLNMTDKVDDINLSDVLGTNGITNRNNDALAYTFEWYKGSSKLYTGENGFSVKANTTSNGTYILKVIASRVGYTSQTTSFEFDLEITKLTITNASVNNTSFVYANKDFTQDIKATLTGAGLGEENLKDLLNAQNTKTYYFTLSGKDSNEIKNVGVYTLTLNLDNTIFEDFTFSKEVKVEKATVVVTQDKIPANIQSKYFSETDPKFTFDLEMFTSSNPETISITLVRESGENAGEYDFISASTTHSENYQVQIDEAVFTINPSSKELNIKLDSKLSIVYSGSAPVLTSEYNQTLGKWTLKSGESLVTITLSYTDSGENYITGDVYKYALQNVTFALNEKYVGTYKDSDIKVQSAGETNFASFTFAGEIEITKLGLVISKITKTFDRNNNINENTTILFENLVGGDDVSLSGTFNSVTVSNNVSFSNLTLTGKQAGNYTLANADYNGGIIKPLTAVNVKVEVVRNSVTYGDINNTTNINDLVKLLGGVSVTIDGVTTDLANNYLSVTAWTFKTSDLSSSNNLKAGQKYIKIIITSSNFTGLESEGYEVMINVNKKELNLSGMTITKSYDGTTYMPSTFNTSLEGYIYQGDDVSLDKDASAYTSKDISSSIKVNLVMKGEDSANYQIVDNVYGVISEYTITFNVNASTENESLVTDGKFVEDNETVVVKESLFAFSYPSSISADEIIAKMTYPTRKGYTAVGWKYIDSNGDYIEISSNNIMSLLQKIAYDTTNTDSSITIYTVWEIDNYKVNVTGENLKEFAVIGDKVTGNKANGYYVEYYSDIEISVEGVKGYKIQAYNVAVGDYNDSELTDTGATTGTASIKKVSSEITFNVTFVEIEITINIDINLPEFTNRTDRNNLTYTYKYLSELSNMKEENLPSLTVTQGTYYLNGYSYNNEALGNKTLKGLIDNVYPNLESDNSITLKAEWLGENYTITFDANGGTLVGQTTTQAVYGSALSGLSQATNTGKSYKWQAPDGQVYSDGDVFKSIGTLENKAWNITFTAEWTNNPYNLEVEFDEKIKIRVNGSYIKNGDVFTIVYSEEELDLAIEPSEGYTFVVNSDSVDGDVETKEKVVTISNLIENGTILISSTPADNTLTLFTEKIDNFAVKVDGKDYQIAGNKIIAKTESEVIITFNATKGYVFNDNSVVFTGSGKTETVISEDKSALTLTWKEFINASTIKVSAKPADNIVTIGDVSAIFETLTLNGTSINVKGGTFTIKTEDTLNINGAVKYGYENVVMTTANADLITSQANAWSNSEKLFRFTATVEGFNEDFTLSFTCVEREYTFSILVNNGQENLGEITCASEQVVKFGNKLTLSANSLNSSYIFDSWVIGNEKVSKEKQTELTIDQTLANLLESTAHGEDIKVYATFRLNRVNISLTSGNKGEISVYQTGSEKTLINGNETKICEVTIGTDLYIELNADDGYEFDKLLINGIEADESEFTFDSETQTITIYLPLEDNISSLKVTFKASDAYVYVQASVLVNFEINRGTTAGGKVYIADKNGNKLDESLYLNNNGTLIIGGDYKMLSKTDDTIYFVAEANSGFDVTLNSYTPNVILNEYTSNGVTVYSFSGITNGARIEAIFSASENTVTVMFIEEGATENSLAGKIYVDTSSSLVNASNNNSQKVVITAITGQTLNITVNSNFTYLLSKDSLGYLKYHIVKGSEDGFNTTAYRVVNVNPSTTGFTNSSSLTITNVNDDAIIYIYVIPRQYNLEFYIDEENSIVLENALTYGKSFSISGLTDEQRELVFREREGYTLGGYYTKQLAQGNQYIDKDGLVTGVWLETGYFFNGTTYECEKNFNSETNTFTIYPAWIYNKSTILIDFTPEGENFKENNSIGIRDIILNIDASTSWVSQDNKWFAEVIAGSNLKLQAYEYEGYEFMYWLVTVNGENPVQKAEVFTMAFPMGEYFIKAIYQPKFTITIENTNNNLANGGTSCFVQDGTALTGTSFDSEKYLSLEATPIEGYKFLYWQNTKTGEFIYGNYDNLTGKTTYTFADYVNSPLYLKAVFEGKTVVVNLDASDVEKYHEILSVSVNGQKVDYSSSFDAKVGDEIVIIANKRFGYGFEMNGGAFVQSISSQGYYVFSYTFAVENLTAKDDYYTLDLVFKTTKEQLTFKINTVIVNSDIAEETTLAGKLEVVDANGNKQDLNENNIVKAYFGDTFFLYIEENVNYKFLQVYVKDEIIFDITSLYDGKRIVIDGNFMEMYFSYEIQIVVEFRRLTWTDEEYRSVGLYGQGTEDEPYYISSASDLAFLAYAVNNGLENANGEKYADLYYVVTGNLDFEGKYWEPIGTEENPFNGIIEFGSYNIKNVTHYIDYINPETTMYGLFWHVTEKAKITQNSTTLIVILSIIGSLILVLATVVIIVLIMRKRRKKEIDDLAE